MPLSRRRFNPANIRIPLGMAFTLPFVIQIVGTVGLVGYLSYRSGMKAVENLAYEFIEETANQIVDSLDSYLQKAHSINQSHVAALKAGAIRLNNLDLLHRYLILQHLQHPEITSLHLGTPKGEFRVVHRVTPREIDDQVSFLQKDDFPYEAGRSSADDPSQLQLYAINPSGELSRPIETVSDLDVRERPWYRLATETQGAGWTNPFQIGATNLLTINAYLPFYDESEQLQGVFSSNLSLDQLNTFLNKIADSSGVQAFILERDGMLIADSSLVSPAYQFTATSENDDQGVDLSPIPLTRPEKYAFQRIAAFDSPNPLIVSATQQLIKEFARLDAIHSSHRFRLNIENNYYFFSVFPYQEAHGLDWLIVVNVPESEFVSEVVADIRRKAILSGLVLLGSIAFGIWISRKISCPLLRLAQATQNFSGQSQDQVFPTSFIAEVEILSSSFQAMTTQLQNAEKLARNYQKDLEQQVAEKTAAWQESTAKLEEAQRIANIGSWDLDLMTGKTSWSEQLFLPLGLDPDQSHDLDIFEMTLPEDREPLRQAVEEAVAHGTAYEVEHRILCPDGKIRYLLSRGEAIVDGLGKVYKLTGTAADITDRKQVEGLLRQSEAQYLAILENQTELITRFRPDGRLLFVNDAFCRYFGVAKNDVIGHSYTPVVYPDDQPEIDRCLATLSPDHPVATVEHRVIVNGSIRWMQWINRAIYDPQGQLLEFQSVGRDIHEQKLAEARLQQLNRELNQRVRQRTGALLAQADRERTLRTIIQTIHSSLNFEEVLSTLLEETRQILQKNRVLVYRFMPDGSATCISESVSTTASPLDIGNLPGGWLSLFTCAEKEIGIWQQNLLVISDIDLIEFNQAYVELLEGIPARAYIFAPILLDEEIWGLLATYHDSPHNWQGWEMNLVQQISVQTAIALRQSQLYQIAQAQVKELERLNLLKDDFLSTVSHELRTPMTNIKMAIHILEIQLKQAGLLHDQTSGLSRYLAVLKQESQREVQLINDLLDYSRLQATPRPLTLNVVSLQRVIPTIVEPFVDRAHQQQQRVVIEVAEDLPLILTHLAYLERILQELLNNACKYTPSGETIRIAVNQDGEWLRLEVTNSGVEIPVEEQEQIFAKFYRILGNDPWRHGGTGLGLALVKEMVLAMGGHITVVSHDNQTSFQVLLPFAVQSGQ